MCVCVSVFVRECVNTKKPMCVCVCSSRIK